LVMLALSCAVNSSLHPPDPVGEIRSGIERAVMEALVVTFAKHAHTEEREEALEATKQLLMPDPEQFVEDPTDALVARTRQFTFKEEDGTVIVTVTDDEAA